LFLLRSVSIRRKELGHANESGDLLGFQASMQSGCFLQVVRRWGYDTRSNRYNWLHSTSTYHTTTTASAIDEKQALI
jgi:hypothetical protein